MIGKLFHIPKPKKFSFTTRYYDPEQEERDEREKRIKEELGIVDEKVNDSKSFRPNIKGQFRSSKADKSKTVEQARRSSNTRLLILIVIFSLIAYFFFFSDFNFFK